MSSNKEAQAARNAADRRLRERFIQEYAQYMEEEHAKRGLTWNRRATPEERARREAEDKQAKAAERILREAQKAGLRVEILAGETVAEKVARIGNEAEEQERQTVDSGSYADDIVNQHSAPVGGW